MKINDTLTAEIKVVKIRRGEPTVVLIDGKRFVYEPSAK